MGLDLSKDAAGRMWRLRIHESGVDTDVDVEVEEEEVLTYSRPG